MSTPPPPPVAQCDPHLTRALVRTIDPKTPVDVMSKPGAKKAVKQKAGSAARTEVEGGAVAAAGTGRAGARRETAEAGAEAGAGAGAGAGAEAGTVEAAAEVATGAGPAVAAADAATAAAAGTGETAGRGARAGTVEAAAGAERAVGVGPPEAGGVCLAEGNRASGRGTGSATGRGIGSGIVRETRTEKGSANQRGSERRTGSGIRSAGLEATRGGAALMWRRTRESEIKTEIEIETRLGEKIERKRTRVRWVGMVGRIRGVRAKALKGSVTTRRNPAWETRRGLGFKGARKAGGGGVVVKRRMP